MEDAGQDIRGLLRSFFDVPDTPGRILRGDYQNLTAQAGLSSLNPQESIRAIPVEFQIYFIDAREGFSARAAIDRENRYYIQVPQEALPLSQPHRHSHLELVYILDGAVDFVIEDGHKRYGKGAFCLMNTNVHHAEVYGENFSALYLNFPPAYLKKALESTGGASRSLLRFLSHSEKSARWRDQIDFLPVGDQALAEQTLYRLVWENLHRQPGYAAVTQQLLSRLVSYLQQEQCYAASCNSQPFDQEPAAVERALRFLLENPRRLTREEIAGYTGYNGSYLNRVFLAKTGQTLAQYNRRIYLNRAAQLLRSTSMPVSGIAAELGFESRSAFYAQFEGHFGMSPGDYRRQAPV